MKSMPDLWKSPTLKSLVIYFIISAGLLVVTARLIVISVKDPSILNLLRDILYITIMVSIIFLMKYHYQTWIKFPHEELRLQEMKFRELFENASDAIFLYEVRDDLTPTQFLEVNRVACEQLGYSHDELLAMTPVDIQIDKNFQKVQNHIKNMINNGPTTTENFHIAKDGQSIPCELSMRIFQFERKKVVLSIVRYIAERKKAEEQLLRSEKLAIVGEMAAGVAHEIRNPLTAIKGFLQLLQEQEQNHYYATIILSEVNRINKIVSDFLILAKPHEQEMNPVDLCTITKNAIELMRPKGYMTNVQLTYHCVVEPCFSIGNEDHLKQVLINVLNNAIEAMPKGGIVRVDIQRSEENMLLIRIIDQGVGIAKERIEKLGEPFFTTKEKGTGLGLTVSKRIIEAHHGSLVFTSEEGTGTTVEIYLPAV